MSIEFVFLLMVFLHIVNDYNQGWLNDAKTKSWWSKNSPAPLYKYDYIWALIIHSFSWVFTVMLPLAYIRSFEIDKLFVGIFVANLIIHAIVDDLKANRKKINLWVDQLIHIVQLVATIYILW